MTKKRAFASMMVKPFSCWTMKNLKGKVVTYLWQSRKGFCGGRMRTIITAILTLAIDKNTYLVDIQEIHRNNCDVTEILKKLEVI